MAGSIRERLREAIHNEENKAFAMRKESHERTRMAEDMFAPVCQAAEDIREELSGVPNIEFTINPTSVWITLFDREIRFTIDADAGKFLTEESGHNWYDGEAYSELRSWDDVDVFIDAMIRFSVAYARMARAIQSADGVG